jgi:hypothetical protein
MTAFSDFSKSIVTDFLHSVIFADDRISFLPTIPTTEIVTPTRENTATQDPERTPETSERTLDVRPIIEECLNQGIPCSFYTLKEVTDPNVYIRIFRKADALILDWQINNDDGEFILSILNGIFDKERNALKVVLLYTSSPNLRQIIQTVKERFSGIDFSFDSEDQCSIKCGSFKVSVYAKTSLSVNQDLLHRVKDESRLIVSLLDDFTSVTSGLVSNAALKAITVLRTDTHRILSLYNKELDPAFLAHRGSLPVVDDAGDLLKDSILNSIKAILDYNYIENECSIKPIRNWIDSYTFSEKELQLNKKSLRISAPDIIRWQKDGFINMVKGAWRKQESQKVLDENKLYNLFNNEIHKKALPFFLPDGIIGDKLEEKFSLLTHHKSNCASPSYTPRLTLGTVVQGQKTKKYWVCVQQKCDSVRLDSNPRRFLFLPLLISNENGKFNVVIPENDTFIKVKVDYSTHSIRTIKFKANKDGSVYARRYGGSPNYFFIQYYKERKIDENFKWVLDLKDAHAQRISNMYAAKLSRVGLDESEWLRRWGQDN